MPTKKDWKEYIKALEKYIKALKEWLKKQPGNETAEVDGGSNPPPPPPPPPGT